MSQPYESVGSFGGSSPDGAARDSGGVNDIANTQEISTGDVLHSRKGEEKAKAKQSRKDSREIDG